jgi:hypothetical protein
MGTQGAVYLKNIPVRYHPVASMRMWKFKPIYQEIK